VQDWFKTHLTQNNEFSTQLRRKSIIANSEKVAKELYRITAELIALTGETSEDFEDNYNFDKTMRIYKSGGEMIRNPEMPKELQFALLCFFRNQLVELIFKQKFGKDLEYLLGFLTDLNCSRDSIVISQWIANCLLELHQVEIIHNEHKHKYN